MQTRLQNGYKSAIRGGFVALGLSATIVVTLRNRLNYLFNSHDYIEVYAKQHNLGSFRYANGMREMVYCDDYNSSRKDCHTKTELKFMFDYFLPVVWGLGVVGGFMHGFRKNPHAAHVEELKQESQETKITTTDRNPSTIFSFFPRDPSFVYAPLNETKFKNSRPAGILAFDADDTLLDTNYSYHYKKTILLNEILIKQRIEYAIKHNIMIIIITARPSDDPIDQVNDPIIKSFCAIRAIMEKLGIENFSGVYFTNGKPKVPVLKHLLKKYFNNDSDLTKKIALIDNDQEYLDGGEKFFTILKPEDDNDDLRYLHSIDNFIKGCQRDISMEPSSPMSFSR